jgi:hypothetical protein
MKDMQDLLFSAGGANWLSCIDLRKGFWQIPMDEGSKELTAFTTHVGSFNWNVMPFGLAGASATFQRVMNNVLQKHSAFAQAYIDDIIVYSDTFEQHLDHINKVLGTLNKFGFSANLEKCNFAARQIQYLGHKIGGGSHAPDEKKIEAIKNVCRPTTKKEVRAVLGLTGFYRTYIPNFAKISAPLTDLTRKNAPNKVIMGEAENKAFEELKEALCKATKLSTPDIKKPFQVHADASDFAVGGCLTQRDNNGNFKPIAFVSKKLSPTQKNWATIEKEAWGILFALTKFEKWIFGTKVEIITDHNPLRFLNDTTPKSPKLTRWALALQRWDYVISHSPGKLHLSADALSRLGSQTDE